MARQINARDAQAWGSMMSDLARAVSPGSGDDETFLGIIPTGRIASILAQGIPDFEEERTAKQVRDVLRNGRWSDTRSGVSEDQRLPSVTYAELLRRYGVEDTLADLSYGNIQGVLRELGEFTTGGTLEGGTRDYVDDIHGTGEVDPYRTSPRGVMSEDALNTVQRGIGRSPGNERTVAEAQERLRAIQQVESLLERLEGVEDQRGTNSDRVRMGNFLAAMSGADGGDGEYKEEGKLVRANAFAALMADRLAGVLPGGLTERDKQNLRSLARDEAVKRLNASFADVSHRNAFKDAPPLSQARLDVIEEARNHLRDSLRDEVEGFAFVGDMPTEPTGEDIVEVFRRSKLVLASSEVTRIQQGFSASGTGKGPTFTDVISNVQNAAGSIAESVKLGIVDLQTANDVWGEIMRTAVAVAGSDTPIPFDVPQFLQSLVGMTGVNARAAVSDALDQITAVRERIKGPLSIDQIESRYGAHINAIFANGPTTPLGHTRDQYTRGLVGQTAAEVESNLSKYSTLLGDIRTGEEREIDYERRLAEIGQSQTYATGSQERGFAHDYEVLGREQVFSADQNDKNRAQAQGMHEDNLGLQRDRLAFDVESEETRAGEFQQGMRFNARELIESVKQQRAKQQFDIGQGVSTGLQNVLGTLAASPQLLPPAGQGELIGSAEQLTNLVAGVGGTDPQFQPVGRQVVMPEIEQAFRQALAETEAIGRDAQGRRLTVGGLVS
jgi:hypothetical protein